MKYRFDLHIVREDGDTAIVALAQVPDLTDAQRLSAIEQLTETATIIVGGMIGELEEPDE